MKNLVLVDFNPGSPFRDLKDYISEYERSNLENMALKITNCTFKYNICVLVPPFGRKEKDWPVRLVGRSSCFLDSFDDDKKTYFKKIGYIESPYKTIKEKGLNSFRNPRLLDIAKNMLDDDELNNLMSSYILKGFNDDPEAMLKDPIYNELAVEFLGKENAGNSFSTALERLYGSIYYKDLMAESPDKWFSSSVLNHMGEDTWREWGADALKDRYARDKKRYDGMSAFKSLEGSIRAYLGEDRLRELGRQEVWEYFCNNNYQNSKYVLLYEEFVNKKYFDDYLDDNEKKELIRHAIQLFYADMKEDLVTNRYFNGLIKDHFSPDEYKKLVHDSVLEVVPKHGTIILDSYFRGYDDRGASFLLDCLENYASEDERNQLMHDIVHHAFPDFKRRMLSGHSRFTEAFNKYLPDSEKSELSDSLVSEYYPLYKDSMALNHNSGFSRFVKSNLGEERWRELGRDAVRDLFRDSPNIFSDDIKPLADAIFAYFNGSPDELDGASYLSYLGCVAKAGCSKKKPKLKNIQGLFSSISSDSNKDRSFPMKKEFNG